MSNNKTGRRHKYIPYKCRHKNVPYNRCDNFGKILYYKYPNINEVYEAKNEKEMKSIVKSCVKKGKSICVLTEFAIELNTRDGVVSTGACIEYCNVSKHFKMEFYYEHPNLFFDCPIDVDLIFIIFEDRLRVIRKNLIEQEEM